MLGFPFGPSVGRAGAQMAQVYTYLARTSIHMKYFKKCRGCVPSTITTLVLDRASLGGQAQINFLEIQIREVRWERGLALTCPKTDTLSTTTFKMGGRFARKLLPKHRPRVQYFPEEEAPYICISHLHLAGSRYYTALEKIVRVARPTANFHNKTMTAVRKSFTSLQNTQRSDS